MTQTHGPLHVLTEKPSVASHIMAQLRDRELQQDQHRFRENLRRLGQITAYEISRTLDFETRTVQTPLAPAKCEFIAQPPVLAVIMRAGLPFYTGFLDFFPQSENAFIGAYRAPHREDNSFDIAMDYVATPDLKGRTLILIDPMLATGKSLARTYEVLLRFGEPAKVHVASVIASRPGVDYLQEQMPKAQIWCTAIDEKLNDHYYIVPGLGDAGDLAFGGKL